MWVRKQIELFLHCDLWVWTVVCVHYLISFYWASNELTNKPPTWRILTCGSEYSFHCTVLLINVWIIQYNTWFVECWGRNKLWIRLISQTGTHYLCASGTAWQSWYHSEKLEYSWLQNGNPWSIPISQPTFVCLWLYASWSVLWPQHSSYLFTKVMGL